MSPSERAKVTPARAALGGGLPLSERVCCAGADRMPECPEMVEGPGRGTNKDCTHEPDSMNLSQGVQYKSKGMLKSGNISFPNRAEWRERSPSEVNIKKSGDGHLNRIAGEFVAAEQPTGPGSDHYTAWHMSCVPTQSVPE
jgi:hypothetical protein